MRCKQEGAGVRQQDSSDHDAGPNPEQEGEKGVRSAGEEETQTVVQG